MARSFHPNLSFTGWVTRVLTESNASCSRLVVNRPLERGPRESGRTRAGLANTWGSGKFQTQAEGRSCPLRNLLGVLGFLVVQQLPLFHLLPKEGKPESQLVVYLHGGHQHLFFGHEAMHRTGTLRPFAAAWTGSISEVLCLSQQVAIASGNTKMLGGQQERPKHSPASDPQARGINGLPAERTFSAKIREHFGTQGKKCTTGCIISSRELKKTTVCIKPGIKKCKGGGIPHRWGSDVKWAPDALLPQGSWARCSLCL